jgi:hypothetical protein
MMIGLPTVMVGDARTMLLARIVFSDPKVSDPVA